MQEERPQSILKDQIAQKLADVIDVDDSDGSLDLEQLIEEVSQQNQVIPVPQEAQEVLIYDGNEQDDAEAEKQAEEERQGLIAIHELIENELVEQQKQPSEHIKEAKPAPMAEPEPEPETTSVFACFEAEQESLLHLDQDEFSQQHLIYNLDYAQRHLNPQSSTDLYGQFMQTSFIVSLLTEDRITQTHLNDGYKAEKIDISAKDLNRFVITILKTTFRQLQQLLLKRGILALEGSQLMQCCEVMLNYKSYLSETYQSVLKDFMKSKFEFDNRCRESQAIELYCKIVRIVKNRGWSFDRKQRRWNSKQEELACQVYIEHSNMVRVWEALYIEKNIESNEFKSHIQILIRRALFRVQKIVRHLTGKNYSPFHLTTDQLRVLAWKSEGHKARTLLLRTYISNQVYLRDVHEVLNAITLLLQKTQSSRIKKNVVPGLIEEEPSTFTRPRLKKGNHFVNRTHTQLSLEECYNKAYHNPSKVNASSKLFSSIRE